MNAPISESRYAGPTTHVKKRHRPRDENDDFKQICDRTTAKLVSADRQKRGLKNEAEADREKIESHWPKYPAAQLHNSVRNRRQKTDS